MKVLLLLLIVINQSLANTTSYLDVEKAIEQYQQKIGVLQKNIDKSSFDDEEILIAHDFDAEKIIGFIQENFVYQHYVGLLRGVQGTLNARAGNALDQSVLLAKLLKDAGYETRIANGVLAVQAAKDLVNSMGNAQISEVIGNGADFEQALAALTTDKQSKIDWQKTETYNRYKKSKSELLTLFKENNITLKNTNVSLRFVKQARDYFWVQYRMSASDDWQSAHPALKKGQKVTLKADSYFSDTVPEKYLHQLKIELFIQQRIGTTLSTHSLMKAWQRPIANLENTLLTYSNVPSGSSKTYDLGEVVSTTTYFTPTFNGNAVGDKVFDLKGRIIDASAMKSGAQGAFFQTLGNKAESALDTFTGKSKDETLMQLTAQWLQFIFTQPDGTKIVQKRYLYQTDDYKVTQNSITKAKFALMSEYKLLTSTGGKPSAYLANQYLSLINDSVPLLKASAKLIYTDDEKLKYKKDIPANGIELLTQYRLMQSEPNQDNKTIKYKATANLIGFKKGFIDSKKAFIAVDVINNRKNYIIKKDNKVYQSAQAAFSAGVWETASEWLPSRFLGIGQNSLDTLQIQAAAKSQNIPMKILKISEVDDMKGLSRQVVARLTQEIADGYTIVIPANTPQNAKMTAWWRVNLSTGETLGMTADGGGQSATEYLINLTQTTVGLISALKSLAGCDKITNDVAKLCCLVEAHFNNVGGLAFGGILGSQLGTAASVIFDVADNAKKMISETGLTPSTNGAICKKLPNIPNL